jgi:hypothetical protein
VTPETKIARRFGAKKDFAFGTRNNRLAVLTIVRHMTVAAGSRTLLMKAVDRW